MNTNKFLLSALLILLGTSTLPAANADQPKAKADNSIHNAVDKHMDTVLPEDQSNNQVFLDRTATIRSEINAHENLSVAAKNIKIITLNSGTVVLRGPVENESEKQKIVEIANKVSAGAPVKCLLDVKNK